MRTGRRPQTQDMHRTSPVQQLDEVEIMAEKDNVKIARDFIAAYDMKSWDKYAGLCTSDVVYDEKATQRRTQGVGQMVEAHQTWGTAFPDSKGKITNCFGGGDLVGMEVTWTGKHTGALTTPAGTIPPTNKPVNVPAAFVITFQGGKIKEAHHYFDMADLLRQIGATPKK